MTPLLLLQQALRMRGIKYDPDQPRDDHGRWTDGGGESGGNSIDINSDEFKDWFKGSVVTDNDGSPLEVYHGTGKDGIIGELDRNRLGENTDTNDAHPEITATAYIGFWFNSGEITESGPYEKYERAYLSIKNPLEFEDGEALAYELKDVIPSKFDDWSEVREAVASWVQEQRKEGFDGVIINNDIEFGGSSYIIFQPEQVKFTAHSIDKSYRRTRKAIAATPQTLRQRKAQKVSVSSIPAIDRIANRLEPQLRKRFLAAVQASKDRVDIEALARAVQSGNVSQAALAARLNEWPEKYGGLAIDLRAGFLAGGQYAYELLEGSSYNLRFDLINPYAVSYAQRKLPQIVQAHVDDAKQIIRDIITEAVSGKYTAQTAAMEIRNHIGLTDRYSLAVVKYREELASNGITGEKLDGKAERYAAKLLRARAKTIARTEIIQSQVAGRRALWNEAANTGIFDRHTAKRKWNTHEDERTCPLCMAIDGQEIPFNGVYTHPDLGNVNIFGEVLNGPTLHPNCRCSEDLIL